MINDSVKIIANNKKAYHEYFVLDKLEAGIELVGTEVKSIRAGRVNLKESWCMIKNGEIFVNGMHISPSVYFKNSKVKVEIGLCKGKNLHDKRETLAKKQAQRDIDRAMKERSR